MSVLIAAAMLLATAARAHCPMSYQLVAPGGLWYQVNMAGNHYDGMMPGGVPGQLGNTTRWTEVRRMGQTTGNASFSAVFTDGTQYVYCPTYTLNLSGPPSCDEDGGAGRTGHPSCAPTFTVVQTAPGVYSCATSCQAGPWPLAQNYTPPAAAAPTLSTVSPSSAPANGGPVAVTVSGSGFVAGALVQWNGQPLPTIYLNGGQAAAILPKSLLTVPGANTITVSIPGAVSASKTFTVTP